ncbi:MAG: 3-deoxy-D-manno-octulosonic acid transferase [Sulfurihydrogenibium sp.]|nr:MAG: 3-deoxy-D-manno-octulosonic acid transferase [Sulfurihydrogenibium sp.]
MVHLIRFLYGLTLAFLFLIFVPIWYVLNKKKGYDVGLLERLVLKVKDLQTKPVWIHCASTGELKTAMPIINYISSKEEVLITVFSPRSYDFALKNLKNAVVVFLPFDFSFLIKRFIKHYKPKILIIEEAEFWFNLVYVSSKSIPVLSINTKIPKNVENLYYRTLLKRFSKFILRNQKDAEVLKKIVEEEKITVCGNLKLLSQVNEKNIDLDKNGKKIILAGSTHNPEENVILEVFLLLKQSFPDLSLVLAPRHTERVDEILEIVKKHNLSYSLRSKTNKIDTDVYIVDTLGELAYMYRFADAIFIGGTIANVGGHNIFEAILSGKKVIIGSNYHKIKDLVEEAEKLNAIFIVKDKNQLKEAILKVLNNPNLEIDIRKIQSDIYECYKKEVDRWI